MERVCGLLLVLLTSQLSAQSGNTVLHNPYLQTQRSILRTYEDMLVKVDSVCKGLSWLEQRKGSEFMEDTYSLVMESYVDKGDPADPALTSWMSPWRKFGGDNPNTIYQQAPIDPTGTYELSGRLGDADYFGLQVYSQQGGFNLPSANLSLKDLVRAADGSFTIALSAQRPADAKNWVPLMPGDHCFLTREYFFDRARTTPGSFTIRKVTGPAYTTDAYEGRLEQANEKLREYVMATLEITELLRSAGVNRFPAPDAQVKQPRYGGALYPTKDNTYDGFWMELKPGEAIHLHGRLPRCTYASFVFYDRWYTTPDYLRINSYLTDRELKLNPDGTYDVYISPERVDHPNWIDTGGLYTGSLAIRYLLATERSTPEPHVVNVKDVR